MAKEERTLKITVATGFALFFELWATGSFGEADANKRLAVDLFDAGVHKMEQGNCERSPPDDLAVCRAAREAFQRAFALYPAGLGALRNLAYVEKGLGLTASASRSFRELSRRAPLDPKPARRLWADYAEKELEGIAPRVPHLTIAVDKTLTPSVEVTLDGETLPAPAWGTALDVDPGEHVISAKAGARRYQKKISLQEGDARTIQVALPTELSSTKPPDSQSRPVGGERERRSMIGPLILGSVGLVVTGVGGYYGYRAVVDRKAACGDAHFCDRAKLEDGLGEAHRANWLIGSGLVTVVGSGIWLWLGQNHRGTESGKVSWEIRPTPFGGTLEARGTF